MEKRSVVIAGHATSVALEADFWDVLEALAARDGASLAAFIERVDAERNEGNLASALRRHALAEALQGRVPEIPAED